MKDFKFELKFNLLTPCIRLLNTTLHLARNERRKIEIMSIT